MVQAYRKVSLPDIGETAELVHNVRVHTIDEAMTRGKKWKSEGLELSFAGKITGEDGECLVDVAL